MYVVSFIVRSGFIRNVSIYIYNMYTHISALCTYIHACRVRTWALWNPGIFRNRSLEFPLPLGPSQSTELLSVCALGSLLNLLEVYKAKMV